jgi:hypothetical protein
LRYARLYLMRLRRGLESLRCAMRSLDMLRCDRVAVL